MKELVLKNSETHFQIAETRFRNAQIPLSRIFFARTWMQKTPEHTKNVHAIYSKLS